MGKLTQYRQIIEKIFNKHSQYKPSHGEIESISILDFKSDNYLLLDSGWDKTGRVHAVFLHLRIVNEKIWIEWDGTETGITEDLLNLGVDKQNIVLAFMRPQQRKLTDFAVV